MFCCVFDTETTNTNPWKGEIIQIAAVILNLDTWDQVAQFEQKMQFDVDQADPKALEINGYDPVTWQTQAVSQQDGLKAFDEFVKPYRDVERVGTKSGKTFYNLRVAGHNIDSFDIPFVRAWYKRYGAFCPIDFTETLDTLSLAKWLFNLWYPFNRPENMKLETLCKVYGVELNNAHDALADVTANARLMLAMRNCKPKVMEEKDND